MDGQQQRQALNSAEQAIKALGAGDPDGATQAAERAVELDQVGLYGPMRLAVLAAADQLRGEGVTPEAWTALREAVGPGPLQALVDEVAG